VEGGWETGLDNLRGGVGGVVVANVEPEHALEVFLIDTVHEAVEITARVYHVVQVGRVDFSGHCTRRRLGLARSVGDVRGLI
jgi:hypothetical protein